MEQRDTQFQQADEVQASDGIIILNPRLSAGDIQPGDRCPVCRDGTMDYDGLLNLVCSKCKYSLAGACT